MDARGLLAAMVVHYVDEGTREHWGPEAQGRARLVRAGMAQMLTHASTVLYGEDEGAAAGRVGEMVEEIMAGRADHG